MANNPNPNTPEGRQVTPKEGVPQQKKPVENRGEVARNERVPSRRDPFSPSYGGFGLGPFSLMRRMMEDMDRLFTGGELPAFGMTRALWAPQIEVFDRGDQLVVRADLPGVDKKDVKLELTDAGVVIEGERRVEREENEGGVYRSERSYGLFQRLVPLPENVDRSSVKAEMKSGVLEISFKRTEQEPRGRRIEIGEGGGTEGGGKPSVH